MAIINKQNVCIAHSIIMFWGVGTENCKQQTFGTVYKNILVKFGFYTKFYLG